MNGREGKVSSKVRADAITAVRAVESLETGPVRPGASVANANLGGSLTSPALSLPSESDWRARHRLRGRGVRRNGAIAAFESERRNGCVGDVVTSSIAIAVYQMVWADSRREILGMRIASDRRD